MLHRVPMAGTLARILGLVTFLSAAAVPGAAGFDQDGQAPSRIIALVITPGQALALPPGLDGSDVLVDGTGAAQEAIAAALSGIAGKGGRPGLLVPVGWEPRLPGVLTSARVLLVDVTAHGPGDAEQLAFLLKTELTAARAAGGPSLFVGIAGRPATLEALLARDVGPYADFLAWAGAGGNERTGHRVWRAAGAAIPALASVEEARSAARGSAAERWLWRAPAEIDAAAGLLAALAAPAAQERFASGTVAARALSVEEIIARHQAAAARQSALVRSLISTGTLTLSFDAPGFPAGVTIGSDTVMYASGGRTELEHRRIRVNGIAFQGAGVPRLPIIEPERAVSPPLTITLDDLYRYRLAGEARIAGNRCYVVEFQPIDRQAALFTGRAWIAAEDFAMVKVAAAQTGLRGAIVASEQVDEYAREAGGVWLLARSDVRQMYEGAAHRTPIHRVLVMSGHTVNPPDFAARLQAAYASDSVMLRDTAEGFRYLRRDRRAEGGDQSAAAGVGAAAIEPEVAAGANRVRTLAAGVIIDPNISTPLPFAGLSYVDFDLLGTGAQLSGFFGGSYAQVAFSVPSLGGRRWHLAGRAFGIASSYNDRAFANGREQYAENIRQRPAHASVWLLRPLTPRISVRAGYDLDYTHFAAADVTSPAFAVPASQVVHGARLALDAQRRGWNASLWWNPATRGGWRPWGIAGRGDYEPRHRDFQRYGASLSRAAVLSPRLAGRIEGAWMAGRDLDRFSRYAFGTFDNRLRGYPSALIRYDRGGVVRGALAWSAGRYLRIDGFLDSALVRDPAYGSRVRSYTGAGAAIEAPAPFGLLVAAEWGYGLRGVNADGTRGTHVIRVSAFKIF
jgi:hypothetical protein